MLQTARPSTERAEAVLPAAVLSVCVCGCETGYPASFLPNVRKEQGIIKHNFSPESTGKELLPGCSWGQSLARYFLRNNSHGALWKPSGVFFFFFPSSSTSLNFHKYSAIKAFTPSHVS